MSKRTDALMRVGALLWALVAWTVGYFIAIAALVWMVLDVLWQLIAGTEGLSASSGVGGWLKRGVEWPVNVSMYALFGTGNGIQWLP